MPVAGPSHARRAWVIFFYTVSVCIGLLLVGCASREYGGEQTLPRGKASCHRLGNNSFFALFLFTLALVRCSMAIVVE